MVESINGFENLAKKIRKMKDGEKLGKEQMKQAAEFFAEKLRPNIPRSMLKKGDHIRDHLIVNQTEDGFEVAFDDVSWYWRFPENGTGGDHQQGAQHFVRGTFDQNESQIEKILLSDLIDKLED